ncbi:BA14K family protein [Pseudochrobactrum sp. MP213Fo]|uniref:BA14K family protein n=1 Tax=Pseudochrobactrum sp. MP213Fo TaxID=3022250 RepID=UPI003B9E5778
MNMLTKTTLIAGLSLATLAGNFSAASADDWGRRNQSNWSHNNGGWNNNNGWRGRDRNWNRDWDRRDRRNNRNDAIAAGVLGLAAGAIIAGAISQPQPQPVYREPIYNAPPPVYYPPTPARGNYNRNYQGSFQPWSREWYNWCSQRYRSFNAQSGTFRGYDGQNHFCVSN